MKRRKKLGRKKNGKRKERQTLKVRKGKGEDTK